MVEKINYKFADFSKEGIEMELRRILDEAVAKNYGKMPNETISKRIKEEWHAMERSELILDVAAMYEIVQWLKEHRYPYWMRGCTGSSFVLYMLGITTGNPLPPHLYCPDCKSVEFFAQYRDGFDIINEEDGTCGSRIADGHNIPWQTLWGYGDHQAVLDADLPKDLYEDFKELLANHWLIKFDSGNIPNNPHEGMVDCLKLSNISLMFVLNSNEISPSFYDKEYTAKDWVYMMENWQPLVQYEEDCQLDIPTPSYFCDLVAMSGLLHATGAWDEETEFMVFQLGYSLSDMIAFRDDVFFYLMDHDFIEKDAWRGMNRVRKGLELPVITDEMVRARDLWVLGRCHHIKYLFPKAHAVEYIFFKLRSGISQPT